MNRVIALAVAIATAGVWVVLGLLAGLDYGLADAGTARADAPGTAVALTLYAPLVGGPLLVCAAALRNRQAPYLARRCGAVAAICFAIWVIARIVLAAS